MQEQCEDYSELEGVGCCLNCPNSYKGCLCFECKCSKCFWYSYSGGFGSGHCDKIDEIIRKKKELYKKQIEIIEKEKFKKYMKEKEKERVYWEEEHPKHIELITIKPMDWLYNIIPKK